MQIANKLKLDLNEVDFYEPFMTQPKTIPGRPYTEDELVDYIEEHDRSGLQSFIFMFLIFICGIISLNCSVLNMNKESWCWTWHE